MEKFKETIRNYYKDNKRDFPWRRTHDPYKILVSEIMLQQTQTARVIEKYEVFIKAFPTVVSLANISTSEVLKLWQGLGYNRRALYLKRSAEIINKEFSNKIPDTKSELIKLPGIGENTAGAILAFAYNKPEVFIETNIRRVFIHEFFQSKENVSDQEILPLIRQTLPRKKQQRSRLAGDEITSEGWLRNPEGVSRDAKEWYYALMDYGAFLAKVETNANRRSKHYTKQSKFEGSFRQVRGKILKLLLEKPLHQNILSSNFENKEKFKKALEQLEKEEFIKKEKNTIRIK